jgi:hypothetical protein
MKYVLYALACTAILTQATAGAQTPENQLNEELKAHITAPKSLKEAGVYYGAEDGYGIANSPKITADHSTYGVFGRIEITPNQNSFIARYYFEGLDSPDPRTRQITRESLRLFGRTKTPYFQVKIPSTLQKAYASNARMNSVINVIGTYIGNTEILMTTNQRVQIPVFEALFLQFEDNGPVAMISLKQLNVNAPVNVPQGVQEDRAIEKSRATIRSENSSYSKKDEYIIKYSDSYFQCDDKSNIATKLICSDHRLRGVNGIFQKLSQSVAPDRVNGGSFKFDGDNQKLAQSVNQCQDMGCIETLYMKRILELCKLRSYVPGATASMCEAMNEE